MAAAAAAAAAEAAALLPLSVLVVEQLCVKAAQHSDYFSAIRCPLLLCVCVCLLQQTLDKEKHC